jgi:glycine/D-amino acid oxidase-like deaminating enzyme
LKSSDAIVIGAGMVGSACAWALAESGFGVTVIESGVIGGGATGAGMGHLCVLDDSEAQFALSNYSLRMWDVLAERLPRSAEFTKTGTIWVAADAAEMIAVDEKFEWYRARGIDAQVLDPQALYEAEPNLRAGLAGGLLLPGDRVVYAPPVAKWMVDRVEAMRGKLLLGRRVAGVAPGVVTLADGQALAAGTIVVATGAWSAELFRGIPVSPRKGHLAITERYPGFARHQLIELAYIKNAHGSAADSVSFNLQPRPTGQLLIGSSRQYGRVDTRVEPEMLRRVLARGVEYMPGLGALKIIRAWTGHRPATPDGLPIIGAHPAMEGVYFATGHEGMGLTTSLGTAALIAAMARGERAPFNGAPYLPARLTEEARV